MMLKKQIGLQYGAIALASQTLASFGGDERMRFFWIFGAFLIFLISCLNAQTGVLTVCDVLSHLDQYRNKVIVVKGVVRGGYIHGFALHDSEHEKECPLILTAGRHWPSGIDLIFLTKGYTPEEGPVTFVPDSKSIEAFLVQIKGKSGDYAATFVGELRSRENINIFSYPEGVFAGNGYGEGGKYPAQLLVKSVKEFRLADSRTGQFLKK
jgi:hypothetical protein